MTASAEPGAVAAGAALEPACWAVGQLTAAAGESHSPGLLFGLGRGGWYGFDETANLPRLSTCHPQRLWRMLLAVNATIEPRFRMLPRRIGAPSLWRLADRAVLLEVDRDALHGRTASEDSAGDYVVWATGAMSGAKDGWPAVTLRTPESARTIDIDGETLVAAWQLPRRQLDRLYYRHSMYYVSPIGTRQWFGQVVVRAALRQYVHQMTAEFGKAGATTGIAALDRYAAYIEANGADQFRHTRDRHVNAAGASGHRDLIAGFLRESGELLKMPSLSSAALAHDEIAECWRQVIACGHERDAATLASELRRIHRIEGDALREIRRGAGAS